MHIRPYEKKDRENVRNVCIITAGCADRSETEKQFILMLYCDYYIENEPQNCFVLADTDDNAVGYILCSENFIAYRKNFKQYIKDIRKLGFGKCLYAYGEIIAHIPASKKYNAHMHIDLLPEFHSKGYGSQMISILRKHLTDKGVNGLMLVVGSDNKKAVKFYKKNGFSTFINFKRGLLMTLSL